MVDKNDTHNQCEDNNNKWAACKEMLLEELKKLQRQKTVVRAREKERWEQLSYRKGDDILLYHSKWEEIIHDLGEEGLEEGEANTMCSYKRKFGDLEALAQVEFIHKPTDVDDLMELLEDLYITREALDAQTGKAPRQRRTRQ